MPEAVKLAIIISAAFRGGPAFDKAGGGLKGLKAAISKVRAEIMLLAGYAAFNFLKKGFSVFVQFEQRMAEAGSIVGATREEVANFSEQVKAMTRELPQTADELGAGLYDVFSAGVTDSADAIDTLRLAAKAAVAGLTSTAQAVKAGVATMNAFGLSMNELNHIYDVQFLTVKRGILRYNDLVEQIGKIAPSAQAAGQSMEDMFGTLAFLTTKGMNAAMAATALSRAYDALTMPATIQKFRELGIAVADMSDETLRTDPVLVGMRQAIADAEIELDKMNQSVIEATVGYETQGRELNELEMAYNSTKEAMAEFGDEMSDISLTQRKNRLEISRIKQTADKEDRELSEGELARIEALEEANNDLRIQYEDLGIQQSELTKVAKEQEETVNAARDAHQAAGKEVEKLTGLQEEAAASLTDTNDQYDIQIAQTGKFRPLVDIIADLNTEMGSMSEVARAQLIAKIFPQIRARKAIMGIIQDTQTLTANIDEMADATTSGGAMQAAFAMNVDTTASELKLMTNSIQEMQMALSEDLLPVIQTLMETLKPLIQFISSNTEVIWLLIAAFIAYKVIMIASTLATAGFGTVLMGTPIGWILLAIALVVLAIAGLILYWDEITEAVTNFASAIWNFVKPAVDAIINGIEWLANAVVHAWDALKSFASGVADFFINLAKDAWNWGKDLIVYFIKGFLAMVRKIPVIGGVVSDALSKVIGFDERANDDMAKRWGSDAIKYFGEGMAAAAPQIGVAAGEVTAQLEGGLMSPDAVETATAMAPTAQEGGATSVDSHDEITIVINPKSIDKDMDMPQFAGDLAKEIKRQKKTLGGAKGG